MNKKRNILIIFFLIITFIVTGIVSIVCFFKGSVEEGDLRNDYYAYINHDQLESRQIPEDAEGWSHFYELRKNSYETLDQILQELLTEKEEFQSSSIEQKMLGVYLSALDMEKRSNIGFGELQAYLDRIRNAADIESYFNAIAVIYAELGSSSLMNLQWSEDMKDSAQYACYFKRSDLGLGKEILEDKTQSTIQSAYKEYIKRILMQSGLDETIALYSAEEIVAFQKDLSSSALPLSECNRPDKIYQLYTKDEVYNLFNNMDMRKFLNVAGVGDLDSYIITEEKLLKKVNTYCIEKNLSLLKNYSIFCLMNDFAFCLTPEIRDTWLEWVNIQNGASNKKTDEKLASELTQSIFGFEFGKLYVEKNFSEKNKVAVEEMALKILDEYERRIQKLDWMAKETKKAAIKKLQHINLKIGYPEIWPDNYAQAVVLLPEKGGSLVNNIISLRKSSSFICRERVRHSVDKRSWSMVPQTANAYYNASANEIVFPAAIIQAPFYDSSADFSTNLGGIGTIIAHEISHAFDSAGSLYDENGNYNIWWTAQDRAHFEDLSERVVTYYNAQEACNGCAVNGIQTLDENIADLGALSCVTSMLGNDADNLRKLFRQYAMIWASKYTDEAMVRRLYTDVHSPATVRVNAVLSATDAFYIAYPEINRRDKMYISPEKRVKIW